jgi:hypothetical protein
MRADGTYGRGSLFQRKSDDRWIVRVRGRHIGSSMSRAEAQQILDAYHLGQQTSPVENREEIIDDLLALLIEALQRVLAERRGG